MSVVKASGRSRPLENHRPLHVLRASELDIEDEALVDRSAPQMPTGMEKDEEEEIHLQEIIKQQMNNDTKPAAAIPIPEISMIDLNQYMEIYPTDFGLPNDQYVRSTDRIDVDPPPHYDMDEKDREFIRKFNEDKALVAQNDGRQLESLRFEAIVDIFEMAQDQITGSGSLITLHEAERTIVDEPETNVSEVLYKYWANRAKDRLTVMYRTKKAVIVNGQQLQSSEVDPYVAFRAHRARMQTRRNRKSEEQNYEKMIKLRRDFDRLRQLSMLTRQREVTKQELQDVCYKIFKMEYKLGEWKEPRKEKQLTKFKLKLNPQSRGPAGGGSSVSVNRTPTDAVKRPMSKKATVSSGLTSLESMAFFRKYGRFVHTDLGLDGADGGTGDADGSAKDAEEDLDVLISNTRDIFTVFESNLNSFRVKRKKGCRYHETLDSLYVPYKGTQDRSHKEFRALSYGNQRVRFGRRRIGRGGRLWFDRRLPTNGDSRKGWDDDYIDTEPEQGLSEPSGTGTVETLVQATVKHPPPKTATANANNHNNNNNNNSSNNNNNNNNNTNNNSNNNNNGSNNSNNNNNNNNSNNNNNGSNNNDSSATVVLEEIQEARRRLEEVAVAISNWRGLRAPATATATRDESPPRWLRRTVRMRGRRTGGGGGRRNGGGGEEGPRNGDEGARGNDEGV